MGNIKVMINGLPGKMATIIAEGILNTSGYYKRGLPEVGERIIPYSLTGPNMPQQVSIYRKDVNTEVNLIKPEEREKVLSSILSDFSPDFAIDFCKGEGVANENAEIYFKNNIPFVMGSTGADYSLIEKLAEDTKTPCVAYPNMDMRIVVWMDGILSMAENYPDAFKEAKIELSESHQADKPDTSGTMKKMLKNLGDLVGKKFTKEDILSIRDPNIQARILKVPENWIGWHAYHFFRIYNEHDGVEDSEEFIVRRHGGECYRIGTMRALNFLVEGRNKKYFNTMIDVLKRT